MGDRYLIEDDDGAPYPEDMQDVIWQHIDDAVAEERDRVRRIINEGPLQRWRGELRRTICGDDGGPPVIADGDRIVASGGFHVPVPPKYDPLVQSRPVQDVIEDAHARKELEYGAHREAGRLPSFDDFACGTKVETDGTLSSFLTSCHLAEGHEGDHWWSPWHLSLGKVRFATPEEEFDDEPVPPSR